MCCVLVADAVLIVYRRKSGSIAMTWQMQERPWRSLAWSRMGSISSISSSLIYGGLILLPRWPGRPPERVCILRTRLVTLAPGWPCRVASKQACRFLMMRLSVVSLSHHSRKSQKSRCNELIPATLESTLRLPWTRTSDLGPLGPQTRHRIRLGPSSTHVVHEVHHIYCVVVSSLYSFFFPSPQTLVPSAIEVGRAPSVLPNSLGEHQVSEVAPNATSVLLLHRFQAVSRLGECTSLVSEVLLTTLRLCRLYITPKGGIRSSEGWSWGTSNVGGTDGSAGVEAGSVEAAE